MASHNDPNRDLEVKQKIEQRKKAFKKEEGKHSSGWRSKLDRKDWRVRRKNTKGANIRVQPPGGADPIVLDVTKDTTIGSIKLWTAGFAANSVKLYASNTGAFTGEEDLIDTIYLDINSTFTRG